jgi:hypothetical protein
MRRDDRAPSPVLTPSLSAPPPASFHHTRPRHPTPPSLLLTDGKGSDQKCEHRQVGLGARQEGDEEEGEDGEEEGLAGQDEDDLREGGREGGRAGGREGGREGGKESVNKGMPS